MCSLQLENVEADIGLYSFKGRHIYDAENNVIFENFSESKQSLTFLNF